MVLLTELPSPYLHGGQSPGKEKWTVGRQGGVYKRKEEDILYPIASNMVHKNAAHKHDRPGRQGWSGRQVLVVQHRPGQKLLLSLPEEVWPELVQMVSWHHGIS